MPIHARRIPLVTEVAAAQNVVRAAEADHELKKAQQIGVLIAQSPVNPTDLIVLTIGVVVASLGFSQLVTRQNHGRPCRYKRMVTKFLICRRRRRITSGNSL